MKKAGGDKVWKSSLQCEAKVWQRRRTKTKDSIQPCGLAGIQLGGEVNTVGPRWENLKERKANKQKEENCKNVFCRRRFTPQQQVLILFLPCSCSDFVLFLLFSCFVSAWSFMLWKPACIYTFARGFSGLFQTKIELCRRKLWSCLVVDNWKSETPPLLVELPFQALVLNSPIGFYLFPTHCCWAPWISGQIEGTWTEPKSYYVEFGRTAIPTSNGHISETKRAILDPLVPKFSYDRGLSPTLSWKWPSATLSPSFGLFQS